MQSALSSKFKDIISGQKKYESSVLSLGLLITRLAQKYRSAPTPETMNACIDEADKFVEKYQGILGDELTKIQNL